MEQYENEAQGVRNRHSDEEPFIDGDLGEAGGDLDPGDGLVRRGWQLTGAYLLFATMMGIVAWEKLFELDPNEFGDMLAGVFAPLAFLWLVLGFFQQGKELKASVAALRMQGKELQNSVEQQRELVKVTREQMESEMAAVREERMAAEHAAQPHLIPLNAASYSGQIVSMEIGFNNAGTDASHAKLIIDGEEVVERMVFSRGQSIKMQEQWNSHNEMESIAGFVSYFDARGNRRAHEFLYELDLRGGPNGRNRLVGRLIGAVLKPPFPWERT